MFDIYGVICVFLSNGKNTDSPTMASNKIKNSKRQLKENKGETSKENVNALSGSVGEY